MLLDQPCPISTLQGFAVALETGSRDVRSPRLFEWRVAATL